MAHPSNKLVILGLLVRLVPAAFTAHPTDMQSWKTIGAAIYNGQNPYTLPAYGLVYSPLWGFVCGMAYAVYIQVQNSFVFNFVIKLPIIAADMAIAKNIQMIVLAKTKNEKTARGAMMLYLFNPVTILMSSIWGMFDAIPVFLVLLSMISLARQQYLKSSLILGIGIAFKGIYPALLLPLFLYTITKMEGKKRETLGYLASSILVPAVFLTPFLMADIASYINITIIHYIQRPLSNLTYWLAIRAALGQNEGLVSTISFMILIAVFPLLYAYILRKAESKTIAKMMTQILLAFYLVSPTVNEQYIVWLIPPMIIYAIMEERKMRTSLYSLSIITTVYAIANAGVAFFIPINPQLSEAHLWPVMLVCSLIFQVISAKTLQKTIKETPPRHTQKQLVGCKT